MRSFVDKFGRSWTLVVNINTVKSIRALCNLDILELMTVDEKTGNMKAEVLERLASDPILLVDVLYVVCKADADAKNISDEDFGAALSGDCIEYATKQLLEEIIDFFPEAKRNMYRKALAAAYRFAEEQNKQLQNLLNDPDLENHIFSELMKSNTSSSISQESAV
jgi:hypothetical protein